MTTGWRIGFATAALLLTGVLPRPASATIDSGIACLQARQNTDGSWGDPGGRGLQDTTEAVATLSLLAPGSPGLSAGLAHLQSAIVSNTDALARRIAALQSPGFGLPVPVVQLLAQQDQEEFDALAPDYPAGGWGLASGFRSDTITTTLGLNALKSAGLPPGAAVINAVVQAGSPTSHPFTLPEGGSNLVILLRTVTGSVRLLIDTPSSGTFSVDLSDITSPTTLTGLPSQPGVYTLRLQSLSGSPNTYSLEARFVVGDFDAARITRSLSYLGLAQNPDGSWGVGRGAAGLIVSTAEALRTLASYGASFAPSSALTAGVGWLEGRQNADGGFGGAAGASTVAETALAVIAISGMAPDAPALAQAKAFLAGAQAGDGCWNDDSYATALALRALAQAVVAGSVALQGRPAKPSAEWSVPLQVSVNPTGQANPILQFTPTTDQNGTFIVSGIAPGTYDIHVKGSHTLRNQQTVSFVFGSNPVNLGTLREGDANDDNFVTLTDFSILVTTFGKCQGSAGFDPRADFNQSGCVTLQDFSLLATNFGQAGDP